MNDVLREIRKYCGHYSGVGINHENQKFLGRFELSEILDGAGLQISFSASAEGDAAMVFHSEVSTIAQSGADGISLFNLNTNTPFMTEHALVAHENRGAHREFIFRFGDVHDSKSFREEVRLDLMRDGRVGYHYSWGMPDGDFAYRSGVVMERAEKN